MEVALSRSDRCCSLLVDCNDHIKNGRTSEALKTVKIIRKEGNQFKDAMHTFRGNVQSSEAVQRKELDKYTDEEHKIESKITSAEADIKRYEMCVVEFERDVTKHQSEINEAERDWARYHSEYREAKEKFETFKTWWWVPVVGAILLVRELIESNEDKMNEASSRKSRADSDKASAERKKKEANDNVEKSKDGHKRAKADLVQCRKKKAECHQKCTDLKAQLSTIIQGENALSEILTLTKSACKNTNILKDIFKKGIIQLLQSRGTTMKMQHVGEGWRDVSSSVSSHRNLLGNNALTWSTE